MNLVNPGQFLVASRAMKKALALLVPMLLLSVASPVWAFPGFLAGKSKDERSIHAAQIVLMRSGERTVLTVMPDYSGPMNEFAVVVAVPKDVTLDRVTTLRREFVDRVETITAPRFHEWWEMDPCEPGPARQEWERDLRASSETAFLGGGSDGKPQRKVPKELLLTVEPDFKVQGEYAFTLLQDEPPSKWLAARGYQLPKGLSEAEASVDGDYSFLVATVDPMKIELIGGDRAVMSPIRYWTEQPVHKLPVRLGLLSIDDHQELQVFVLDHKARFVPKNYPVVTPPTNIEVGFKVKERVGEFYNALSDSVREKAPNAFFAEYAWSAEGCGQPCATEPLMIHELLTLGGDVFEQIVPEEELNPEPPELTDEEKEKEKEELKPLKPKERKKIEDERQEEREEVARRKALLERHKYVVSRLHYRYSEATLPKDLELRPEPTEIVGGVGLPKGPGGDLPLGTKTGEDQNKLQMRYVHFHPWKGVIKCETPERWRWAKAPRTYRGLRKIWIAEDMTRKSRTQIKLAEVVQTPIPELGLSGKPALEVADAGTDGGVGGEPESKSCGCRIPGSPGMPAGRVGIGWVVGAAAIAVGLSRRSRARCRPRASSRQRG